MQYINVLVHDTVSSASGEALPEIRLQRGTADTMLPYDVLRIGNQIDIFLTRERLMELREKIATYIEAEAMGQRAEQAIEDRDAMETGADRCPPRE